MEPSPPLQELAARLHEEVQERASLGASLARFSEGTPTTGLPSYLEAPLVGRQEEFGALVSEYQAASMGQTRAVAILGEAGIGKTRLAEEFLGLGQSKWGGCARRRDIRGSRATLRAPGRGDKAAHRAREGPRRPARGCVAL